MRPHWFAPFVLLAFAASIAAQEKEATQDVLFEDDFDRLDPAWGETSDNFSAGDGKLVVKPEPNTAWAAYYGGDVFDDGDVTVRVRLAEGADATYGGGPVFWAEDNRNYFYAYVNADGQYAVSHVSRGRILTVSPWKSSEALKKGIGETNELRVVLRGNEATLYANGKELTAFHGRPPKEGSYVGVRADSPPGSRNTWEFSNLRVLSAPPAGQAAAR